MRTLRVIVYLLCLFLPWRLRRSILNQIPGWRIDKGAKIGLSFVDCESVWLEPDAKIGHFNIVRNLESLHMGRRSIINGRNWIAGYPRSGASFSGSPDRESALYVGDHAAITNRHLIDCTDTVRIGAFSTVAGYDSQILTHAINVEKSMQECAPVTVGPYCFIGTKCVLLKGVIIPARCVIAAGSVLPSILRSENGIYGGVPAKLIKELDSECKYFTRSNGAVA